MKKAYIWACIWGLLILAPIFLIYGMYKPVDDKKLDIVKIGVILPFMAPANASSTSTSTVPSMTPAEAKEAAVASDMAYEIMNGLEAVSKRPLTPGAAPAIVFIYEDSASLSDGQTASAADKARAIAEKLVREAGVSALVIGAGFGPATTTGEASDAIARVADAASIPLVYVHPFAGSTFGCGPEGLTDIGAGEAEALSDFCATYQKQHKATPSYFAAYAYDLGNILMQALDMQRSASDTREAIRKAVSAHKYTGITGAILLNSKGKRI